MVHHRAPHPKNRHQQREGDFSHSSLHFFPTHQRRGRFAVISRAAVTMDIEPLLDFKELLKLLIRRIVSKNSEVWLRSFIFHPIPAMTGHTLQHSSGIPYELLDCDFRRGYDTQLLHHAELVKDAPTLGDLSTHNPIYSDSGHSG